MLTTKRAFIIVLALLSATVLATAQKKRKVVDVIPNPPTVNLTADASTVTLCPRQEGAPRVHLNANASSPDGQPLRYTWKTTGGHIVGDGANTVWDLSDAAPGGSYVASVEVTSGEGHCTAFSSIPVAVVECLPLREVCPNISISCPDSVMVGHTITFAADVSGGTPGAQPVYNWSVSQGIITSGQGTPSITVSTAGLGGQDVRATLTVGGYTGLNCTASCSTPVQVERIKPRKFDEIGAIARNDEKARLDIFAAELQNDPRASGYIIASGGKPGEAQQRLTNEKAYLVNTRGLDASRIVTLLGHPGGDLRVQFWLVPAGAEPPTVP
jgi:PKD-like domain